MPHETHDISKRNFVISKGNNGDAALAVIRDFTLNTWSSARSSTVKWDAWVPRIKVELDTLLGLEKSWAYGGKDAVRLLCAFEDREIVVLWEKEGVFELYLSSMKSK